MRCGAPHSSGQEGTRRGASTSASGAHSRTGRKTDGGFPDKLGQGKKNIDGGQAVFINPGLVSDLRSQVNLPFPLVSC